jgi:hypothetical protein
MLGLMFVPSPLTREVCATQCGSDGPPYFVALESIRINGVEVPADPALAWPEFLTVDVFDEHGERSNWAGAPWEKPPWVGHPSGDIFLGFDIDSR